MLPFLSVPLLGVCSSILSFEVVKGVSERRAGR
jgi:hypothetical protein